MALPTWGIVMTADEPEPLVLANVAYHLGTGAAEAHVYLDNPRDPAAAALRALPGCHVTLCDQAHWAAVAGGDRAEAQTRRQAANATHAYGRCGVDWLLHLDADEFVLQHRPLREELQYLPRAPGYVNIPNWERVYLAGQRAPDLFSGVFRIPAQTRDIYDSHLFGELAPFLVKGVTGHAVGKGLVPTGENCVMGVHAPRRGSRSKENKLPPIRAHSAVLAHFDGMTPLHWILKILRYGMYPARVIDTLSAEHRRNQIRFAMEDCDGIADLYQFHDRLKKVDAEDVARLGALGLLSQSGFDPRPAIGRVLPNQTLDLSAAAFDRALLTRFTAMLDEMDAAS